MKNIFKISIVAIVATLVTISSCKKDEMIIEGCTDKTAMNYQELATSNDGSCEFAYDIAQGDWAIVSDCDSVSVSIPLVGDFDIPMADMFPDSVEIEGEGDNQVSIDINGSKVFADIDYDGNVTIEKQTISMEIEELGGTNIDVEVTGSGTIESATSGDLDLHLSFSVLSIPADSDCDITFSR